jgi:hypothetical protein
MKHVYNYQEIAPIINRGKPVTFTRHLAAHVSAVRKDPTSDTIGVTIELSLGEYGIITQIETTYPQIETVLDTFDISDLEEIWEVLE